MYPPYSHRVEHTYLRFQRVSNCRRKRSAGVGARVFIPMLGMLGYDIGYGIDIDKLGIPEAEISPWQYHFIFGILFIKEKKL